MVDEPEIELGAEGVPLTMFTTNVWVAELPQALLAITVMLPEVELAVALMLVVVDVPVQPDGKVQV